MVRDIVLFAAVLLQLCGSLMARDYYVDVDRGSDSNGGGAPQNAWKTITYALERADSLGVTPATINIAEGVYSPFSGETFPLQMRHYVSLSGAGDDFRTVVDAMGSGHVMVCIAKKVTISNLVVMNGLGEGDGAGILTIGCSPIIHGCTFLKNHITDAGGSGAGVSGLSENCHPVIISCKFIANRSEAYGGATALVDATVVDCFFDSNRAGEDGGAIEICKGTGLIEGCAFVDNEASRGGAVHAYLAESIVIRRCEIVGNSAYDGGGIHLSCVEDAVIKDCRVVRNRAEHDGGGILLEETCPVVHNCMVAENTTLRFGGGIQLSWASPEIVCTTIVDNRAAVQGDGICCAFDGRAIISNSILWGHRDNEVVLAAVSYSDVGDQLKDGPGNISLDPLFVTVEGCDYLLSQIASGQSQDSPCVDSGSSEAINVGMQLYSTRTDNASDTGRVDMGYHLPVAMPRAYAWSDVETCRRGEFVRPIVEAHNQGPGTSVDLYVGYIKPGGDPICLTSQGLFELLTPWISGLTLEYGFRFGPQVLMSFEIPRDWASGTYMFFLAFCAPGTTELIGEPATFVFEVIEGLDPLTD